MVFFFIWSGFPYLAPQQREYSDTPIHCFRKVVKLPVLIKVGVTFASLVFEPYTIMRCVLLPLTCVGKIYLIRSWSSRVIPADSQIADSSSRCRWSSIISGISYNPESQRTRKCRYASLYEQCSAYCLIFHVLQLPTVSAEAPLPLAIFIPTMPTLGSFWRPLVWYCSHTLARFFRVHCTCLEIEIHRLYGMSL